MKAVAPRIERLYESEARRWRTAWEQFIDTALRPLTDDELDVFASTGFDLSEEDRTAFDELADVLVTSIFPKPDRPAWDRWLQSDDWDPGFDVPDLSKWPDLIPQPPDEPPDAWDALREIVRTYRQHDEVDYNTRVRARVAAYLLVMLSIARQVRRYR